MRRSPLAAILCLSAAAAGAQSFTTAAEVRPILEAQKGSWVAVREFGGQDLVYFTTLAAWRCGLTGLRYGLNGAPPATLFELEPCYEDTPQPNAIQDDGPRLYLRQPLRSVQSVTVEITYDDGETSRVTLDRAQIQRF